jgi:hypothetical protein
MREGLYWSLRYAHGFDCSNFQILLQVKITTQMLAVRPKRTTSAITQPSCLSNTSIFHPQASLASEILGLQKIQ